MLTFISTDRRLILQVNKLLGRSCLRPKSKELSGPQRTSLFAVETDTSTFVSLRTNLGPITLPQHFTRVLQIIMFFSEIVPLTSPNKITSSLQLSPTFVTVFRQIIQWSPYQRLLSSPSTSPHYLANYNSSSKSRGPVPL